MADTAPIDLASLRRSCGHCSLRQLCLPANIGVDDMARLDDVVRRRRPLKRDERLFHHGDVLTSVYVARSGAFKTVSLSEGGDERIIGFHLPGDLMGLDALAEGEPRCEPVALDPAGGCPAPLHEPSPIPPPLPGTRPNVTW